jgi:CRP-like cAMP-binding protein
MTAVRDNPHGRNRLLDFLAQVDFALLFPHLKSVNFDRGIVLQESGELIEHIYFPQSGMISLLAVMVSGDGVETATVGREGAVNATMSLAGVRAVGRAVVQITGMSSQITASRFQGAMDASPSIRKLIVRYNEAQIRMVYQSVGCNAVHRVEARLCRCLLQVLDRTESTNLDVTQESLSEILGVQRTTVTVLARQLQDAGLIRYRRGRIEVLDRTRLEKRACSCYATIRCEAESVYMMHDTRNQHQGE